jgi:hypothetical protein
VLTGAAASGAGCSIGTLQRPTFEGSGSGGDGVGASGAPQTEETKLEEEGQKSK